MNSQQTPLEKLISDKERIRQQCREQVQKLNNDFSYIQENAGNMLLSGLSSLVFPGSKQSTRSDESGPSTRNVGLPAVALGLSEYLSIAKGMIPLAWELAQPFIVSWGIRKAKKWLGNVFGGKKK